MSIATILTEETVSYSARDFLHIIGPVATLKLCAELGGVSYPAGKARQHFTPVIGEEATEALLRGWAGRVVVPKQALSPEGRIAAACRLRQDGMTIVAIAQALRICERHIYRLLASSGSAPARGIYSKAA